MARPLRIEYEGALYHVVSRGDRREDIFVDEADRRAFLDCVGRACGKTGGEKRGQLLNLAEKAGPVGR